MLSIPSYHEPPNIGTLQKLERYKPSFSRINGMNVTKEPKDVFYRGSPLLSFFKEDIA